MGHTPSGTCIQNPFLLSQLRLDTTNRVWTEQTALGRYLTIPKMPMATLAVATPTPPRTEREWQWAPLPMPQANTTAMYAWATTTAPASSAPTALRAQWVCATKTAALWMVSMGTATVQMKLEACSSSGDGCFLPYPKVRCVISEGLMRWRVHQHLLACRFRT